MKFSIKDLMNIRILTLIFKNLISQSAFTYSKLTIETLEHYETLCSKLTIETPERRQASRSLIDQIIA